jgi:L-iditol 2-dehydrogenase
LKAALLYGKEDLRIEEISLPGIESHGMLLRMKAAGICGSDSRMFFNGPTSRYINPVILSHELCAEVHQVGSSIDNYTPGELVTIAPVIPCMRCMYCSKGMNNICERAGVVGCTIHGGMTEFLYMPSQMVKAGGVVKVPAGIDYHAAALSEVVGCCLHGIRQTGIHAGDRVLILGSGSIGLTFLQLVKRMGAGWVGITGRRIKRLDLARELGADEAMEITHTDIVSLFRSSIDLVIVANSSVRALEDGFKVMRAGGSILLFSGYLPDSTINLDLNDIHYRELHIHSSIDCTIMDFQNAVDLLPLLQMEKLITCTYSLDEAVEAFMHTRDPDCVKVMLEIQPRSFV